MMVEALEACIARAVEHRQAVNPDAAMTSPVMGMGLWFMNPAIDRHSTTPAHAYERMRCVIVGSDVSLRGELFGRDWIIEAAPSVVEGTADAAAAQVIEATPAFDTAQDAQWLRASLELSMAELASLFGVTRKSVYDWLAGTKTPKAAYIRGVRNLLESGLPVACLPYLRQFWEAAPKGGESLLEILKSGDPRRLPGEAREALGDLEGSLSDYVRQLAAKPAFDAPGSADTDDLYRTN